MTWAIFALIVVLFLAQLAMFYFVWNLSRHYNLLIKNTRSGSLQNLLENLLIDIDGVKKSIALLNARCDTMEKDAASHIQKIGLLRFNPFDDTGGDQSFILALVDGNNTGVVISSLYSRSGTRWYAKRVVEGKGAEHELSAEEKRALNEAKRLDIESAVKSTSRSK